MQENHIRVVLDQDGMILDFESTVERLKNKDEIIGQNWFDIFVEFDTKSDSLKLFLNNFYSDLLLTKNLWQHINNMQNKGKNHKLHTLENSILIYDNGKKSLLSKGGRTFLTFGINKYFIVKFFHN